MTISATLSLATAGAKTWEVVIVGAGPAGSVAARELARNGIRVLLVDKQSFPRPKVCGSCLSSRAQGILARVGLGQLPTQLGGSPYDQLQLWSQGVTATLSLPKGIALTRSKLDAALVQHAIAAGAEFLPATQADLGDLGQDHRTVRLKQLHQQFDAVAQVVVAADGIGGRLLSQTPDINYRTWKHSRVGVGATLSSGDDYFRHGSIYMVIGRHGYVGLVRAECGVLNVGAAFDVEFIRCQGIETAIASTLRDSNLPVRLTEGVMWRGTPPLTRVASRVGGDRLFAIGDAAGYAEPFTGEGIAWAAASALLLVPYLLQALDCWRGSLARDWDRSYRRTIRAQQADCRRLARYLRRPWLVCNSLKAVKHYPALAGPLVQRINSVSKKLQI